MPFDKITNSQIKWWLAEYCHSQRDRSLLYRKWVDGIHFEPLAEEFELSVRQTKTITYREQKKLFDFYGV